MWPKDDPNSVSLRLERITDEQNRKVDYTLDWVGTLQSVRFNQTFDGSGNLTQYCQSDYIYQTASGYPYKTRYTLAQVKNSFNWKSSPYPFPNGTWNQSTLVQYAYTYDTAGMRLTNAVSDAGGPVRTETYGYDELYRLTSVNYGDGQTQSYTFDPMGNRASKTDAGGGINGTENSTYNAANMLLTRGAASYTNDTNGNTLTGGGRTNTWDSQNRLYQCVYSGTTTTHTYAADGLRHRTVNGANTTDYILDGPMFVREWKNSSINATYLVGPRGPEYRRDDVAGTVRWYLYDGLGSCTGEVDPSGNITASRKFDVYGSVRSSTGTSTSKHKFVGSLGHPSEDETGLIYMRARYMDPVTGRFVSEDPAKQGANWFSYANDNPVAFTDYTGRIAALLVALVVGAVFAGIGDLAWQSWTKNGDIDWLEVFAVAVAGGAFGVFAVGLAGAATAVAGASSLAEAATAVACCFTAKQVSLAVAAWATGLAVIGGGGAGLFGAGIYIYGRQLQVSALLKASEGDDQ